MFEGATGNEECGYVISKRKNTNTSNNKDNDNNSRESSNKGGAGKVITKTDLNSTGYTGIYESRITGRKFKEYKQNPSDNKFLAKYPGPNWGSECGSISTIIIGSGYSDKATIADVAEKLKHSQTMIEPWLKGYAPKANVKQINSPSKSQLKKLLKDGCVAVVHDPGYSSAGHYMAVLDISQDGNRIYISNPDTSNTIQNGWNSISLLYSSPHYLTDCYFVSNEGKVAEYSADVDDSSESSSSTSTCTGTDSGKYYTTLQKTDGLNRIDFMNSNPEIFHRYMMEGSEYEKYVGYSRSKLRINYWNLKNTFQKVYDKYGSLPWAYGKTLGFKKIYTTTVESSDSNSDDSYSSSGIGTFIWPVPEYIEKKIPLKNQITATFAGDDSTHKGSHGAVDIANSVNLSAKIVAAADGKVVDVNTSCTHDYGKPNAKDKYGCGGGFGNYVIIKHDNGYYTLYGHMKKNIKVSKGDEVKSGQQIGTMGSTGNSSGNHLHFEVRKQKGNSFWDSTQVDPLQFFNSDGSPKGGSLSQKCVQFVWDWEGNDAYLKSLGHLTSDNKYYIIYEDEAAQHQEKDKYGNIVWVNNRVVGHGIDLDAGGFDTDLKAKGYPTTVGGKVPKDFVDSLSINEMKERRNEIEKKCKGLNLKEYQIDALVSRSYQMGPGGWYNGNIWSYCPGETFMTAYKKWWDDGKSDRLYDKFMQYTTNGGEPGLIARRKSEWKLFKKGVYDSSH